MPAGADAQIFRDFLIDAMGAEPAAAWYRWLMDGYPSWAREGWRRIDSARAECKP